MADQTYIKLFNSDVTNQSVTVVPDRNLGPSIVNETIQVTGQVYDKKSKKPLLGVSVTMYDDNNNVIIPKYDLPGVDYTAWTYRDPRKAFLLFELKDYQSVLISFEVLMNNPDVPLSKKSGDNTLIILAALGAGALIAFGSKKKKKQVSGIIDYWNGLPPIAKGIIGVGTAFVTYQVVHKIFSKPPDETKEPKAAKNELEKLAKQGIYPTLNNAQVEGLCQQIVVAADDCGTDEDAIYNAFESLNNAADLWKLVYTYDVREYKGCFEGSYFDYVSRTLSGTISAELDNSEKAHVNAILRSKGINYSF